MHSLYPKYVVSIHTIIVPFVALKVGLNVAVPIMSNGADMVPDGLLTLTLGVLSNTSV